MDSNTPLGHNVLFETSHVSPSYHHLRKLFPQLNLFTEMFFNRSQTLRGPQFKRCACPVGVRTESSLARLVTGTVLVVGTLFSHWYGPCSIPKGAARMGRCLLPSRHEQSCFCLPARTLNRVLNRALCAVECAGFDFRRNGARHHHMSLFGQRVGSV